MGAPGAAAAAAGAAIAQAIKASGVIVRVEPEDFMKLLDRQQEPLVVVAPSGFFSTASRYLMSYKGLAFYTQTDENLQLPGRAEIVQASKIWIP